MTKLIALTLMAASVYAASRTTPAKPTGDPIPGDPLTVTMGERKPARVRVARGQATLIRLPDGQRVMNVYGGDKGAAGVWAVDAGSVPTRFLAVKPKEKALHTTLHVISNTGQEISLYLEEVTGIDTQFDAEVDATIDTGTANAVAAAAVKWVPAEEIQTCKKQTDTLGTDLAKYAQQMKDEITATTKAADAAKQAALTEYQQQYPQKLAFAYQWDRSKAERLGFESIWSDDKFTYIKGSRVLALYEINEDGKPSLIQYNYANGIYTVPKILYDGYFAIGDKKHNKLTFHRERKG